MAYGLSSEDEEFVNSIIDELIANKKSLKERRQKMLAMGALPAATPERIQDVADHGLLATPEPKAEMPGFFEQLQGGIAGSMLGQAAAGANRLVDELPMPLEALARTNPMSASVLGLGGLAADTDVEGIRERAIQAGVDRRSAPLTIATKQALYAGVPEGVTALFGTPEVVTAGIAGKVAPVLGARAAGAVARGLVGAGEGAVLSGLSGHGAGEGAAMTGGLGAALGLVLPPKLAKGAAAVAEEVAPHLPDILRPGRMLDDVAVRPTTNEARRAADLLTAQQLQKDAEAVVDGVTPLLQKGDLTDVNPAAIADEIDALVKKARGLEDAAGVTEKAVPLDEVVIKPEPTNFFERIGEDLRQADRGKELAAASDLLETQADLLQRQHNPGVVARMLRWWEKASGGNWHGIKNDAQTIAAALEPTHVVPERLTTLLDEQISGEVRAMSSQVRRQRADLDAAVRSYAKGNGMPVTDVRNMLREARALGKPDMVPDEIRPVYQAAMDQLDSYSREVRGFITNEKLANKFVENAESYMVRQYDIFNLPKSELHRALRTPAASRLLTILQHEYPDAEAKNLVGMMVDMAASRGSWDARLGKAAKKYGISPKSLKERKNISPAVREFYGEVTDFDRIISRQGDELSKTVAWARTMNEVVQGALASGKAIKGLQVGYEPVNLSTNSGFNPFDGISFAPEVAKSLRTFADQIQGMQDGVLQLRVVNDSLIPAMAAYRQAQAVAGTVKKLKVLGNVPSQMYNAVGAFLSAATNMGPGGMKEMVARMPEISKITTLAAIDGTAAERGVREYAGSFLRDVLGYDDPKIQALVQTMYREGILNTASMGGDIARGNELAARATFHALRGEEKPAGNLLQRGWGAASKVARGAEEVAVRVFNAGDNFFRVARVFDEVKKQARAAGEQTPSAQTWKLAMGIVKDTMPTHSRVGAWNVAASQNPLVLPFFSIKVELTRNLYNTAAIALREMVSGVKSGNAEMVKNGIERTAALGAGAFGFYYLHDMMFGENELPEEKRAAAERLLAYDYEKTGKLTIEEHIPGVGARVSSASRVDPMEFAKQLTTTAHAALSGDMRGGIQGLLDIIGLEPAVGAAITAASGRPVYGFSTNPNEAFLAQGQPATPGLQAEEQGDRALEELISRAEAALSRAAPTTAKNVARWIGDTAQVAADRGVIEQETADSITKHTGTTKDDVRKYQSAAYRALKPIGAEWNTAIHEYRTGLPTAAPYRLQEMAARASAQWKRTQLAAAKVVEDLRAVDMSDEDIMKILTSRDMFTKKAATALVNGETINFNDAYDVMDGGAVKWRG